MHHIIPCKYLFTEETHYCTWELHEDIFLLPISVMFQSKYLLWVYRNLFSHEFKQMTNKNQYHILTFRATTLKISISRQHFILKSHISSMQIMVSDLIVNYSPLSKLAIRYGISTYSIFTRKEPTILCHTALPLLQPPTFQGLIQFYLCMITGAASWGIIYPKASYTYFFKSPFS